MTHYRTTLALLAACNFFFSLTDIWTSSVAWNNGFREANSLLLSLSTTLNLSLLATLVAAKLAFLAAESAIIAVGFISRSGFIRTVTLVAIMGSLLVFLLVSVNNALWILS